MAINGRISDSISCLLIKRGTKDLDATRQTEAGLEPRSVCMLISKVSLSAWSLVGQIPLTADWWALRLNITATLSRLSKYVLTNISYALKKGDCCNSVVNLIIYYKLNSHIRS